MPYFHEMIEVLLLSYRRNLSFHRMLFMLNDTIEIEINEQYFNLLKFEKTDTILKYRLFQIEVVSTFFFYKISSDFRGDF